ncbi:MAG: hypothetical protein SFT92_03770 [Rickettsiales bacterium]|nr:hypothetical protein [Rickettsiales bacterium]
MTDPIRHLLRDIFNHDFTQIVDSDAFHAAFFSKNLTITDLHKVHNLVASQQSGGIPASLALPGNKAGTPFAILTQLHGNESAGLAGIVLAMALWSAGKLERDVIGVIGNTLAARQYFEAYAANPTAPQETRDAFRCGLAEDGSLLPDMNRTPIDFLDRKPTTHHIKRAQELFALASRIWGIADIHTARGTMVCYTDHLRDGDLKHSPIRAILTELAEAISANASTTVTVQTFKTILGRLPNIQSQTGIEAGRHESPEAPTIAASFTLSLLHTLGITAIAPYMKTEDGIFDRYAVLPRITYADLLADGPLAADDQIYMAHETKDGVVVQQYDEMQAVFKGQVVAIAKPSNTLLRAPFDFAGIFWSKSAALYDKDPAVGPWPVAASNLANVKFCYPCQVSRIKIDF